MYDGYVPEESNRPMQSEKLTVSEKIKLGEYCIAFNDGGCVIWDNLEQ